MKRSRKLRIGAAAMAVGMVAALVGQGKEVGKQIAPARAMRAKELLTAAQKAVSSERDMLLDIALTDIAVAETRLGNLPAVDKTIHMMSDAGYKAGALLDVSKVSADMGDAARAKQMLGMAIKVIKETPATTMATTGPSEDLDNWRKVGVAQVYIGDITGAHATAAKMGLTWQSAEVLAAIGVRKATHDDASGARADFAEAFKGLQSSTDRFPFFDVGNLAWSEYQAGEVAEASELAKGIKDPLLRAGIWSAIARDEAKKGDRASAMAMANAARKSCDESTPNDKGAWKRARIMAQVAEALWQAGDAAGSKQAFSDAMKTAESAPAGEEMSSYVIEEVGLTAKRCGDGMMSKDAKAKAVEAMKSLPDGNRTHAEWAMAEQLADAGDGAAAREMVAVAMKDTKIDSTETAFQSAEIARGIVEAEGSSADLGWIATLGSAREKALAYAAAARAMVTSGDK